MSNGLWEADAGRLTSRLTIINVSLCTQVDMMRQADHDLRTRLRQRQRLFSAGVGRGSSSSSTPPPSGRWVPPKWQVGFPQAKWQIKYQCYEVGSAELCATQKLRQYCGSGSNSSKSSSLPLSGSSGRMGRVLKPRWQTKI